jgi:hypothetical protein
MQFVVFSFWSDPILKYINIFSLCFTIFSSRVLYFSLCVLILKFWFLFLVHCFFLILILCQDDPDDGNHHDVEDVNLRVFVRLLCMYFSNVVVHVDLDVGSRRLCFYCAQMDMNRHFWNAFEVVVMNQSTVLCVFVLYLMLSFHSNSSTVQKRATRIQL